MYTEKFLLILASLLVCNALALKSLNNEWKIWKSNYGKKYTCDKEEEYRRKTWEANRQRIMEHNELADQGKKSYWMKINHFADKSEKELERMNCLNLPKSEEMNIINYQEKSSRPMPPPEVDWREKNCVTGVKDQGNCGSCWAFAVVGSIESRYCIKYGTLMQFSEQQLVDCDSVNGGCCGGFPIDALDYIVHNGVMKSSKYKYKGHATECRYRQSEALALNTSKFFDLSGEDNIAFAVAFEGPTSIGFAVGFDFYFYYKGIYDGLCGYGLNHAMLAVGYGIEEHEEYWIVKNSWSEYWGDDGYVKIRRNANVCGIGELASAADLM